MNHGIHGIHGNVHVILNYCSVYSVHSVVLKLPHPLSILSAALNADALKLE